MPHDPVTLREDVIAKSVRGTGHDMVARTQYEAPAGPDGEIADDPFMSMDLANAKWMSDVLTREYQGIPWRCKYDGAAKMAYVSIPILTGVNKYWAINLTTDELTDGLLKRCGGEMLERYGIPRDRFSLTHFLDAREKHSALLVPSRKIPG